MRGHRSTSGRASTDPWTSPHWWAGLDVTELYEGRNRDRGQRIAGRVTPWIAVAILAMGAGVGVATIGASDVPSHPTGATNDEAWVRNSSNRMIESTFNPPSPRGMRVAKVAFRFNYEHRTKDLDAVRERLEGNWHVAKSHVLIALRRHTAEELKSSDGLAAIAGELRGVIDRSLFQDGIGRTYEILWEQVLVQ